MARELKLSALFFIIRGVGALSFLVFLGCLIHTKDMELIPALSISFGVAVLAGLTSFIFGNRVRCQLCQSQLMLHRKCTKHENSSTLFGSYRFKLSVSTLFGLKYTCPFCGESFTNKVIEVPRGEHVPIESLQRTTQHRPVQSIRRAGNTPKKNA